MNKPKFKIGDKVLFGQGGTAYEVCDLSRPPHVGIYDEPPSKHVDYLLADSLTLAEEGASTDV